MTSQGTQTERFCKMKIYVMRHGETEANHNHIICGWLDSPLTEAGTALAAETGRGMKKAGIHFDAAFTSPLVRAKQTCFEVLVNSGNENTPAYFDERLMEVYAGDWDAQPEPGYGNETIIDPEWYSVYFSDPFRFASFPNGELFTDAMKRTESFLHWLSRQDYENVLVTMHGCAMMCMLNFLKEDRSSLWNDGKLPRNCSVNIVEVKDGNIVLLDSDVLFYDENKT